MHKLTCVSDGTLVTCAKQSGIFGKGSELSQNPDYLKDIRLAWMLYTQSTLDNNYSSWVDSWQAFITYAQNTSKEFNHELKRLECIGLSAKFEDPEDNTKSHTSHYFLQGKVDVYDNGKILAGDTLIGHCATITLHGLNSIHEKTLEATTL